MTSSRWPAATQIFWLTTWYWKNCPATTIISTKLAMFVVNYKVWRLHMNCVVEWLPQAGWNVVACWSSKWYIGLAIYSSSRRSIPRSFRFHAARLVIKTCFFKTKNKTKTQGFKTKTRTWSSELAGKITTDLATCWVYDSGLCVWEAGDQHRDT